jgi:splicing factor 3A subunit 3
MVPTRRSRSRRREIASLSAPDGAPANEDILQFYTRLKKISDFHRKYPNTPADAFDLELAGILGSGELKEDQEDRE